MDRMYAAGILLAISASVSAAGNVPEGVVKQIHDGYFKKALAELQPLAAAAAKDPEFQFEYGSALLGAGKQDDAVVAFKAAVAFAPGVGRYHRGLGEAYGVQAQKAGIFSAFGLAKSCLSEFQTAVKLGPDDVDSHVDLTQYYISAPGIAGGSLDKAHAEEAALDKLDKLQALQVRAQEAEQAKDTTTAESFLKQAVDLDKTGDSLMALGFLYTEAKRYPDASQTFRAAAAKDPAAPATYSAWYQIGRVAGFARSGYDEGIADLKQYLAADVPDNLPAKAWAHLRLGNLYEYQGHLDLAKAEYQEADSLRGDDDDLRGEVKKALAHLP